MLDVNQRDGGPGAASGSASTSAAQLGLGALGLDGADVNSPMKGYSFRERPLAGAHNGHKESTRLRVHTVAWNADDTRLVLNSSDFTVRIFNSFNGSQLHSIKVRVRVRVYCSVDSVSCCIYSEHFNDAVLRVVDVGNANVK